MPGTLNIAAARWPDTLRPRGYGNFSAAMERFAALRHEHLQGRRQSSPWFVVVSNAAPGADLLARMELPSWPEDVVVWWPWSPRSEADTALPAAAGAALPPPWADISAALRWCKAVAGEIAFTALPAETLVWKLAALAAYAATGGREHRFGASDLSAIFEQLVVRLQDFPEPPARYRPQENEPSLVTDDRVRVLVGLSGAGKTAWASQAALHAGGLGGGLLAARSGLELLRALDRRLTAEGVAVTVVLDNVHPPGGGRPARSCRSRLGCPLRDGWSAVAWSSPSRGTAGPASGDARRLAT
jgi:hypothetical protein